MNTKRKEKRLMPNRDPSNWHWLASMTPWLLLGAATFTVGLIKALHDGGPWKKAVMTAAMGTILSLSLYPVFLWLSDYYDLPESVAMAPCVFLAFMGVEWVRNKADALYEVLLGFVRKWLK
ncbi:phage holin family protein [Halomonas citrativorans]|uniref:Phage holin family protein n=1 Tax=Halomonas citrativorans TaxID=2742612 RepID=A0ABR9F9F0_9GAMM|nr:phage holin family protein [Halomonas citrativorans]MBE0403079.1 phage holin family protein [Halomonas citrativorans]